MDPRLYSLFLAIPSRSPTLTLDHEIMQNLANSIRQKLKRHSVPEGPPPAYDFVEPKTCHGSTSSGFELIDIFEPRPSTPPIAPMAVFSVNNDIAKRYTTV